MSTNSRKKNAIRNSLWGVIGKLLPSILAFITRKIFLTYLDVQLLGISETFNSILSTLSLTDLGFQSAVVFFMYKPLSENNYDKINELLNYYKKMYQVIAGIIVMGAIIVSPFIPIILKGVDISFYIYLLFYIHVAATVATYLMSYKRALLFADQKEYISSRIDLIINTCIALLRIIVIIIFRSYLLYVSLLVIQTVLSNIIIELQCRKMYHYLDSKRKPSSEIKKGIWNKVKDLFFSKIASYIYGSTDNLIISTFIGASTVGYLSNYTVVKNMINGILIAMTGPIRPSLGNYVTEVNDKEKNFFMLNNLTFLRFFLVTIFFVPFCTLIQKFITLWVGERYLLSIITVALIFVDIYCSAMMGPVCNFINVLGEFGREKKASIGAAVINIVLSLFFVNLLGLNGILLGTAVSQIYIWIARYMALNRAYFDFEKNENIYYWKRVIYYSLIIIFEIVISIFIINNIKIKNGLLELCIDGIVVEIVVIAINLILLRKNEEFKYFFCLCRDIIIKIINR